jgi:alkanesulfonate monooxygenase SsuD/methylene tetrahydromethanopterin reductase-like flavin-dependent oxidoreductase (luciferase family)
MADRGFGIDASVSLDVAIEVARMVENAGYSSFWVNGSPHEGALAIIEAALDSTGLDVGVGVLPLPRISAGEIVDVVRSWDLPQERIWIGVGSNRRPGALDEVRQAANLMRTELDVTVATAAVGPRMMALAGEVADAVVLTWSFAAEVERVRPIIAEAAALAGRDIPTVVSYVRCALLPRAQEAIGERADFYDGIPHYRNVFARYGLSAADTVVTGYSREDLLDGIAREEEVIDVSVIRAIPEANTVEAIGALAEACAP